MSDYEERKERGLDILQQLGWGSDAMSDMKKSFPDLWETTVGHLFGDIWSRPGLSLRERELVTMSTIMALARPVGLRPHLVHATHIGISKEEIMEVILQVGHYAGWPTAVHALFQLNETLAAEDSDSK
ncbi:carboxymuconolactone decarboxylase family protein [Chloroflexota bacterium]